MIKKILLLILSTTCLLCGCSSSATNTSTPPDTELIIAVATSLTDVSVDIANAYKKINPNIKLNFTYGSSGALQLQIEEGAPIDIFMSASTKQMTAIEDAGLVKKENIKNLLSNSLVLIAPKNSPLKADSFEVCTTDAVKTIALGEFGSVPVGQYSQEVFTSLDMLDSIKAKANYGNSARQVLTWVESGEVDCGVVFATDALVSKNISVLCSAPKDSHKPILYSFAVLERCETAKAANEFMNFLSTDEAKTLFEKYGFKITE